MSGELQPFDTERYVEELSRIIGELGDIATRGSGCSDCEEALFDEDAASELVVQNCVEEIESLPENSNY